MGDQVFLKPRHATRQLSVGGVTIGGGAPVRVQSMTNTATADAAATRAQIARLADAGCELARVAVPDAAAAAALPAILRDSPVPVIADIHFDYQLALAAIDAGIHGLRLNPGNIGGAERVRAVAQRARAAGVPIRIGVNAGSLEKQLQQEIDAAPRAQHDALLAQALVDSALRQAALLEAEGVTQIKISLKASSVPVTVLAYRALAARCDYPLHIGITEAGTVATGSVKSAVGLGILLSEGLGDTLRVSLSGPPEDEPVVARQILKFLGLRTDMPEVIACPTCARTGIAVAALARAVEEQLRGVRVPLTVAVMGCVVNGPGEARHADVGICGGAGQGVLFRKGEIVRTMPETELLAALAAEIERYTRP
ncbi:MAG TPA: flavodoxin-dependent (E)-4-hydroxy-3-methylbut-2-enyl-diphosphate synthase [bacterium]|nr:flavodoxin-dependent (E)-4-hydroxy-3-methylbut-2-enyl-diphosphate synthase [bacterium]